MLVLGQLQLFNWRLSCHRDWLILEDVFEFNWRHLLLFYSLAHLRDLVKFGVFWPRCRTGLILTGFVIRSELGFVLNDGVNEVFLVQVSVWLTFFLLFTFTALNHWDAIASSNHTAFSWILQRWNPLLGCSNSWQVTSGYPARVLSPTSVHPRSFRRFYTILASKWFHHFACSVSVTCRVKHFVALHRWQLFPWGVILYDFASAWIVFLTFLRIFAFVEGCYCFLFWQCRYIDWVTPLGTRASWLSSNSCLSGHWVLLPNFNWSTARLYPSNQIPWPRSVILQQGFWSLAWPYLLRWLLIPKSRVFQFFLTPVGRVRQVPRQFNSTSARISFLESLKRLHFTWIGLPHPITVLNLLQSLWLLLSLRRRNHLMLIENVLLICCYCVLLCHDCIWHVTHRVCLRWSYVW